MRKHDVRKWLHAILDLLPVIIIPVFMIYSHRHQIDSYTIDVPQNEVVDFNQKLNGFVNNSVNGIQFRQQDDFSYSVVGTSNANIYQRITDYLHFVGGHVYQFTISENLPTDVLIYQEPSSPYLSFSNDYQYTPTNTNDGYLQMFVKSGLTINLDFYLNMFDLTLMFGAGNEPTINEFNTYFPNDYYEYTTSKKTLVKNVGSITYNDTDVGSQMLYCLYNSVDKYFNLNNVFGFNNVYDWLSLNIFNGNPPIAIYIVWNIALYEFLMDLIMLLYALFMWFIDMCESLIDRSFHVASGRKK